MPPGRSHECRLAAGDYREEFIGGDLLMNFAKNTCFGCSCRSETRDLYNGKIGAGTVRSREFPRKIFKAIDWSSFHLLI